MRVRVVTAAIHATNDGVALPGFPHQARLVCDHVVAYQNSFSSAVFSRLLPTDYDNVATNATIRFFYILCPVDWELAIISDSFPIDIDAGRPAFAFDIALLHAPLTPCLKVKPASSAVFTVVIGLDR